MMPIATDGVDYIGQQERITNIIEGGDRKEYVVEGTHCKQAGQVKQGRTGIELTPNIIHGSQSDYRHRPDKK